MDRIEIARQIAFELHTQAVVAGDDPRHPYAFVLAEAERRKINVEGTAPGAKILDGGRAKYTPEDALILHENVGTPFEQAFLVAHEIGHAELGDALNLRETSIQRGLLNPLRSESIALLTIAPVNGVKFRWIFSLVNFCSHAL